MATFSHVGAVILGVLVSHIGACTSILGHLIKLVCVSLVFLRFYDDLKNIMKYILSGIMSHIRTESSPFLSLLINHEHSSITICIFY